MGWSLGLHLISSADDAQDDVLTSRVVLIRCDLHQFGAPCSLLRWSEASSLLN